MSLEDMHRRLGRVVLQVCGVASEGGICWYALVEKGCEFGTNPLARSLQLSATLRVPNAVSKNPLNTGHQCNVALAGSLFAADGYSSEDGEEEQPVGSDTEEGANGAAVEGASGSEGEEAAAGSDSESGWSELGEGDEGVEAEGGEAGSDSEEGAEGSDSEDEEALELASDEEALRAGASDSGDAAGALVMLAECNVPSCEAWPQVCLRQGFARGTCAAAG